MKKNLIVLFTLALTILAGLPVMAEAQSRRYYENRDAIYGRGYGRGYPVRQDRYGYAHDPYYDQLVRLPGNLVACQMDFDNAGKVVGCHPLVKTVEFLEEHGYAHQNRNELIGTTHVHEGKLHFRPYDDTNQRTNTVAGGAMAGAGGAAIGGAYGGRRGAAVGGVTGAIVGGVIASRNAHDNCLEIGDKSVAEQSTVVNQEASPISRVEQGVQSNILEVESRDENHGPAYHTGSHPLTNASRVYVDVYDGDKKTENFVGTMESGDSWDLARPRNRYRAWAQVPNDSGSFDEEELKKPELSGVGWTFVEPAVARGR